MVECYGMRAYTGIIVVPFPVESGVVSLSDDHAEHLGLVVVFAHIVGHGQQGLLDGLTLPHRICLLSFTHSIAEDGQSLGQLAVVRHVAFGMSHRERLEDRVLDLKLSHLFGDIIMISKRNSRGWRWSFLSNNFAQQSTLQMYG